MTAVALDREKLAAVLGMLGSTHDGEILAAARQAERLRRTAGVTWGDILRPAAARELRCETEIEIETVADALDLCAAYADRLTPWERNFCATLNRQRSPISPKQIAILDQILVKVKRAWARAA